MCDKDHPTAIKVVYFVDHASAIYMPLYDVSIEPAMRGHASFNVDGIVGFELPQIGALKGFVDGCYPVSIFLDFGHGKANTIVRHTLVYFEFMGDGRG